MNDVFHNLPAFIVNGVEAHAAAGFQPPEPKEYPNIPAKYRVATTSELTLDVKEGPNTMDIELK